VPTLIEVDTIVLCAGQEPCCELEVPLRETGLRLHLIGGADMAAELDVKRAIAQGTRLAATLGRTDGSRAGACDVLPIC
jgi:2,4-dienoyl-CoA reductase (NADPH2)